MHKPVVGEAYMQYIHEVLKSPLLDTHVTLLIPLRVVVHQTKPVFGVSSHVPLRISRDPKTIETLLSETD